jgi:hypothetical protein
MRGRFLLPAFLIVAVGFVGADLDAPRAPKYATITAACTPGSPSVEPHTVQMSRADNVEWREPSGRAISWTITPKDPARWPFGAEIRGNQQAPANSGTPGATGTYSYNVTIQCADGSTQVIDPDIIIGDAQ